MLGRKGGSQYEEIEEYRDLLHPPEQFEEGFTIRTIIGALFISVIMVPGNMYLDLMIGGGIGAAAQWVTIILFMEIAKRSFVTMKKQEIYLLLYVSSALVAAETGMFEGLIWSQYFVQSPAAQQFGIAKLIPHWVSPQPESEAIINRTFLHKDWLYAILLLVLGTVFGKLAWFTGGYVLFRVTSDYERLPYPFAPIAAHGAMALAEESSGQETWRWRLFSVGAVIGMVWGVLYVGVPTITGALAAEPIQLIPIPFWDVTQYTGYFLPAAPMGITLHLGPIFAGLVAPYWGIIGSVIGAVFYTVANPILYHNGLLPSWFLGMDTIQTQMVITIDFWMSFSIGITFTLAVIGFYQLFVGVKAKKEEEAESPKPKRTIAPPPGRGDFRIWVCLLVFGIASLYGIVLAKVLFPDLVSGSLLMFLIFFGFVYTPVMSWINARLIGMVGQTVSLPYVKETTIFLSGFRGIDIWFVPFPLGDYGAQASKFREIELTGLKFTSIVKAEIFMVPLVFIMSFLYWSYIWKLSPIPSATYPYAQKMWPLRAFQSCIFLTSTIRGEANVKEDQKDKGSWSTPNLIDGYWWFWRVRATYDVDVEDPDQRRYGEWSEIGHFYTDFEGLGLPSIPLPRIPEKVRGEEPEEGTPPAPVIVSPQDGVMVNSPTVNLNILPPEGYEGEVTYDVEDFGPGISSKLKGVLKGRNLVMVFASSDPEEETPSVESEEPHEKVPLDTPDMEDLIAQMDVESKEPLVVEGGRLIAYLQFEVDQVPTFDGTDHQTSDDKPLFFKAIKPEVIGVGFLTSLLSFVTLSVFGLPILLIFGFVHGMISLPHFILPSIIGALLAKYYFWPKYGKKQWRLYATVLTVGFGVGMSLMGMASVAISIIQKSVTTILF